MSEKLDDSSDDRDEQPDAHKGSRPTNEEKIEAGGADLESEVSADAQTRVDLAEELSQKIDEMREEHDSSVTRSVTMAGPIPSPPVLKAYDVVSPGLAEKIIDHWVREQQQRHSRENQEMKNETLIVEQTLELQKRGQTIAGLLVFCGFLLSGFFAWFGYGIGAVISLFGILVGMASVMTFQKTRSGGSHQEKDTPIGAKGDTE
jgi:uncharacterized membrane protein